jgi:hypothetical protein
MATIEQIVHYIAIALSLIGVATVVLGVGEAAVRYMGLHLFRTNDESFT